MNQFSRMPRKGFSCALPWAMLFIWSVGRHTSNLEQWRLGILNLDASPASPIKGKSFMIMQLKANIASRSLGDDIQRTYLQLEL